MLSVLIGVSAAYLGGFADDFLSLFTDVFLVIPTFPLIIVIVAYAHNGGNIVLVSVLVATGWSYGAAPVAVTDALASQPGLPRRGAPSRREKVPHNHP